MKNKLQDLNDHLFAQLERLADENMSTEQIEREISRGEAMVKVADQINETAKIRLKGAELYAQHGEKILPQLPQIGSSDAAK
jgi:transcriptional/translational regulatory protein YebC/TACO1